MMFSVLHNATTGDEDRKRRDRSNLLLLNVGGVREKRGKGFFGGGQGRQDTRRKNRRGGVSYAHLLSEEIENYDPMLLCGNFKLKRHSRAVMKMPGVVSSVVFYVREKDRRKELNDLFQAKHGDWLTAPKMSLSKAKKIKSLMLEIALWLDMELSTAGLAYSYFERLVLRNVVSKYNRKAAAGAALLLAFKYNEPLEINTNQMMGGGSRSSKVGRSKHLRVDSLIDQIELKLHVKRTELLRTELGALVHLRFDLSITPNNALHLFEAMLAASPYDPYDGDGLPKEYVRRRRRRRKTTT